MCYTVIVAVKRCQAGHTYDAAACYRQCETQANLSSKTGKWNILCDPDARNHDFIEVRNIAPTVPTAGGCRVCVIHDFFGYAKFQSTEGRLAILDVEISREQKYVYEVACSDVMSDNHVKLASLLASREALEEERRQSQLFFKNGKPKMDEELEKHQDRFRLQMIAGFEERLRRTPDHAPVWFGDVTIDEQLATPHGVPQDFPPLDFFGAGEASAEIVYCRIEEMAKHKG